MLVTLDPRDERPLYLQIVDQVRRALLEGTLRAEDPLPSVRELAGQLVVNPRTVSQAYRELEGEGVIYVRRGQGTFVAPTIHPDRRERRALVRGVAQRTRGGRAGHDDLGSGGRGRGGGGEFRVDRRREAGREVRNGVTHTE